MKFVSQFHYENKIFFMVPMNYETEYVLFRIGVLNSQQTLATESQYTFMKTPSIRRQCITLECVAMAGWRDISLTSGHPHTSLGVHLYSILWSHETLLYHFTLLLAYLISILFLKSIIRFISLCPCQSHVINISIIIFNSQCGLIAFSAK